MAAPQGGSAPSKGRVLIVGAGPAGLVAAMHIANRGFQVSVYDRRQDPSESSRATAHTYPMAVSPRAVTCIEAAGAKLPMLDPGSYYYGSVSALDGRVLFSMAPEEGQGPEAAKAQQCYLVDQVGLCQQLAAEASRLFPGAQDGSALTVHWGQALTGINFERRVAKFARGGASEQQQQGEEEFEEVQYDLLIGADGARSRTRELMEAAVPGFSATTLIDSKKTYKTFLIPPPGAPPAGPEAEGHTAGEAAWKLVPGLEKDPPRRHLYVFGTRGGGAAAPRVVFWKREDGAVSGMVTEEAGWDPEQLRGALSSAYPNLPPAWLDAILEQGAGRKPSSFSRIVSCSRLDGPGCLLIGDAAHAMTSSLGQGCNTALDGVTTLIRELDACGGDLRKLPGAYNAARLPDARAMQRLEEMAVLGLPGSSYGTPLERLAARAVVVSASVLGKALARAAAALTPLRQQWQAAFQQQEGGQAAPTAAGAAAGPGKRNARSMFEAPWAKQMLDPSVRPRAILRGMHALTALAVGLLVLSAAAAVSAAAAALRLALRFSW